MSSECESGSEVAKRVNVFVFSRFDMLQTVKTGQRFHTIVSIGDSHDTKEEEFNKIKSASTCHFVRHEYLDTDVPDANGPKYKHMLELVELAEKLKESLNKEDESKMDIAFHCQAGVSRSTSSAYVVMRELGFTHAECLARMGRFADPNKRMLLLYTVYQEMFVL
jgi:predicted protein tyrosine phosphatase